MKIFALTALALTLACCSAPEGDDGERAGNLPGRNPGDAGLPREYTVVGPFIHQNLAVFLIQPKRRTPDSLECLTLEEALRAGTLRVTEHAGGAQVNLLEIENTGDRSVYIQAGDTVKGGQQDRTLAVDCLVPPRSGKMPISAFCVEPGRWHSRVAIYGAPTTNQFGGLAFTFSDAPVATRAQKLAIRLEKNQQQVWTAGTTFSTIINGAPSSGSYVLAVESADVQKRVADYVEALKGAVDGSRHPAGMAFAVNGALDSIDLYGDSGLFLKLWPKLLRSAALEASTEKGGTEPGKTFQARDLEELLSKSEPGEATIETLPGDLRVRVWNGSASAIFDTDCGGVPLHRQIIMK